MEEARQLIKDFRLFFQTAYPLPTSIPEGTLREVVPHEEVAPLPAVKIEKPKSVVSQPVEVVVPKKPLPKPREMGPAFSLHPMPIASLVGSFTPKAYVLLFEESSLHQFFLENLARALTMYGMPTKLLVANPKWTLKEYSALKCVLAPWGKMRKYAGEKKIHQYAPPFFFLAPLDDYETTPGLKRTLWNSLRSTLPLSSSI